MTRRFYQSYEYPWIVPNAKINVKAINLTGMGQTVTLKKPQHGKFIAVTQAQTITIKRAVTHVIAVTQAQTINLVRAAARKIALAGLGQNVTLATPTNRPKSIAVSSPETVSLIERKAAPKSIAVTQAQTVSLRRSAAHVIAIVQAQTVSLRRAAGKIIQVLMAQLLTVAAHGQTSDQPSQILVNTRQRLYTLTNGVRRIYTLITTFGINPPS